MTERWRKHTSDKEEKKHIRTEEEGAIRSFVFFCTPKTPDFRAYKTTERKRGKKYIYGCIHLLM
jgi:hypothetical protein